MKEVDHSLYELTNYIEFLYNEKYFCINKGHLRKLRKLLKNFMILYSKTYWF